MPIDTDTYVPPPPQDQQKITRKTLKRPQPIRFPLYQHQVPPTTGNFFGTGIGGLPNIPYPSKYGGGGQPFRFPGLLPVQGVLPQPNLPGFPGAGGLSQPGQKPSRTSGYGYPYLGAGQQQQPPSKLDKPYTGGGVPYYEPGDATARATAGGVAPGRVSPGGVGEPYTPRSYYDPATGSYVTPARPAVTTGGDKFGSKGPRDRTAADLAYAGRYTGQAVAMALNAAASGDVQAFTQYMPTSMTPEMAQQLWGENWYANWQNFYTPDGIRRQIGSAGAAGGNGDGGFGGGRGGFGGGRGGGGGGAGAAGGGGFFDYPLITWRL